MNFIEGIAEGGSFVAPGVSNLHAPVNGNLTLGFRAEDVVQSDSGRFKGKVFEVEPTGEATYVVLEMGEARTIIRAAKKFRPQIGSELRFELQDSHTLFFDTATGRRIRAE